jgi:DNA-binding GntR family transcriptional regulator
MECAIMTRRLPVPAYQRIADALRTGLVRDADAFPQPMASEEDLARVHGVSRGTIRNALKVLEGQGLIRKVTGHNAVTIPDTIRTWQRMQLARNIVVTVWAMDQPHSFWGRMYR